ncbi:MAG: efflux RND transporter permease subunit [Ignavibacteriae bacterium]|nr:efflux RND transporter permease subunit [Ignavibacteriota bacterium]
MKISEVSIDNRTSVFILTFIILIIGITSYISLPREAAPDVSIPMVIVSTPYFGVSPEDIESLITQPIEKELNAISEIKKITSSSLEGFSTIQAEFESGYDIDDALQKVREKVDKAEAELPSDAEKPNIIEINFSEFPIMTYNISGPVGLVKLKDIADELQDKIENITGVLEVKISGGLEREVQVNVDANKLVHFKVRFKDVIDAITNENKTIPGGSIDVENSSFLVRVPGEFDKPFIIQDLIVKLKEGRPIYLKDVATVNYSFKDRTTYARLNEVDCVTLNISKRTGSNIVTIADNVKSIIKSYKEKYPETINFQLTVDQSEDTKRSVKNLENNIFSGLVLVLLVLFLLLGGRNAMFVALAIPLSMLIAFILLSLLGITLNMVVLFSLILALGMLVDNAIVVIENIYKFLEEGNDLITSAKMGTKEVAWPITTSTLTTLVAFGPLIFWPGIVGDFMSYLPITLILTLASSLFVALVINPVFASKFMKLEKPITNPKSIFEKMFFYLHKASSFFTEKALPKTINKYKTFLSAALGEARNPNNKISKRTWFGLLGVFAFLFLIIPTLFSLGLPSYVIVFISTVLMFVVVMIFTNSKMKVLSFSFMLLIIINLVYSAFDLGTEFFPTVDPERVFVSVEGPTGTNIEMSNSIAKKIEKMVKPFLEVDVKEYVANVGSSNNPFDGGGQAVNKSTITVQFVDYNDRQISSIETSEEIRKAITGIAGAIIEVKKEEAGPPVGKAITVEISGDDLLILGNLTEYVKKIIKTIPGAVDLNDNYSAGKPEIKVEVDRERAALYGLNTSLIANTLRTAINGFEASKYRINEDEYDITVRLEKSQRKSIDILKNIKIVYNNKKGKTLSVPLSSVATISYDTGPGGIMRKNLKRVVTVTGDVDATYNANEVLGKIQKELANFNLPPNYEIGYGGQQEFQKESEDFLSRAFMIAFFGIFLILVIQFNSLSQPVMIMFAVAVSLIGVFIGLIVFQMPFGIIMTGIGVISLAGVVVNNNIVLIDYINILRRRGLSVREAVIQAGLRRFRPVTLTAVTTVLGLIPLTFGFGFDIYSFSFESGGADAAFWRSMGIAVIFGLIFGTVLTLIVVPVLFTAIEDAIERSKTKSAEKRKQKEVKN